MQSAAGWRPTQAGHGRGRGRERAVRRPWSGQVVLRVLGDIGGTVGALQFKVNIGRPPQVKYSVLFVAPDSDQRWLLAALHGELEGTIAGEAKRSRGGRNEVTSWSRGRIYTLHVRTWEKHVKIARKHDHNTCTGHLRLLPSATTSPNAETASAILDIACGKMQSVCEGVQLCGSRDSQGAQ